MNLLHIIPYNSWSDQKNNLESMYLYLNLEYYFHDKLRMLKKRRDLIKLNVFEWLSKLQERY